MAQTKAAKAKRKRSLRNIYTGVHGSGQVSYVVDIGLGRNSCYRSADILVRLGLANAAEADKNVRAPFAFLHVLGNGELRRAPCGTTAFF
ncbi:MAG: hypothetical protein NTX51_00150 [Verrucomicrobia bacterium]|nr:hypothetical protein [Verrucomicrobiota bacterium]